MKPKPHRVESISFQTYQHLLGDLLMEDSFLHTHQITSYMAKQQFEPSKKTKTYFHAQAKVKNQVLFYELNEKDTVLVERLLSFSPTQLISTVTIPSIHRSTRTETLLNKNVIIQKKETWKNETLITDYKYEKGTRTQIKYSTGHIEQIGKEGGAYLKSLYDTLYSYTNEYTHDRLQKRLYSKSLKHVYQLFYDNEQRIQKIIWNENPQKWNATILFQYDSSGKLIKRTIQSAIKAFPNSETYYTYQ
ncbi:MAG: hypothetical protein R2831_03615 [Chitinophagaceae bacterium]